MTENGRSRDTHCWAPPPQIRTCGTTASDVVNHIRCVMWPSQLSGEEREPRRQAHVSGTSSTHNGAVYGYNEAKNAIRSGGFRPAAADGGPDRLLSMIAHAASALAFISMSTSA